MILATTNAIEGKKIKQTIGLVKGSTIRARWFGRDIAAGLKSIVGGEIKSYTDMMEKARDEAIKRMAAQARAKGANAVVGVRIASSGVMQGASEIVAYGTAVKI